MSVYYGLSWILAAPYHKITEKYSANVLLVGVVLLISLIFSMKQVQ